MTTRDPIDADPRQGQPVPAGRPDWHTLWLARLLRMAGERLIFGRVPPIRRIPRAGARDAAPPPLAKLDPVLQFMLSRRAGAADSDPEVHVLVRFEPSQVGAFSNQDGPIAVTSMAATILAGLVRVERLLELAALDAVLYVEGPRPMREQSEPAERRELTAAQETTAGGASAGRGRHAIVGIIDSGIWFQHNAFRKADRLQNDGSLSKTRIKALWCQSLPKLSTERSPALPVWRKDTSRAEYGVEFNDVGIERVLAGGVWRPGATSADEDAAVAAVNGRIHGTHVANIAAGSGIDANGTQTVHTGVASDADLMIVVGGSFPASIPVAKRVPSDWALESPKIFDAANFLRQRASASRKPIAINVSQGDHFGPHDGTSLLEEGLSEIGSVPGCIVVVAAGNSYEEKRHASGVVSSSAPYDLNVRVTSGYPEVDFVDIWYSGEARIEVAVVPPGDSQAGFVGPAAPDDLPTWFQARADTEVGLYSQLNVRLNGHHRICISLRAKSESGVAAGMWTMRLKSDRLVAFHAWAVAAASKFVNPTQTHTVMTPACAKGVISIGAFDASGPPARSLHALSAIGPTRDGRRKPDLCAPGVDVISIDETGSALPDTGNYGSRVEMTSNAAPHVTGTVACMLDRDPKLSVETARHILTATSRSPAVVGSCDRWGAGELDTNAAVLMCR